MAHIEKWYVCPVCNAKFDDYIEAARCRDKHGIRSERWAVGEGGKAVRIFDHRAPNSTGSAEAALIEADLSDFIFERKLQLQQEATE